MPEPARAGRSPRSTTCPRVSVDGVVMLANELLDNLPFGIAEWDGARLARSPRRVRRRPLREVLVPMRPTRRAPVVGRRAGHARADPAWHRRTWFARVRRDRAPRHRRRRSTTWPKPPSSRARPLAAHVSRRTNAGARPVDAPGTQDITADVVLEQLVTRPRRFSTSTTARRPTGCASLGIEELVDGGRRAWDEAPRAATSKHSPAAAASTKAAALTDPAGLGAHRVVAAVLDRRGFGDSNSMTETRSRHCSRKAVPSRRRRNSRRTRSIVDSSVYDDAERDWQGFWAAAGARARLAHGVGHDPRLGSAVREVVRRGHAQRLRELPRPPCRTPATATRSRSTGRASPATRAPSPTASCSTRRAASRTCCASSACRRATGSRSTWGWCPRRSRRCSRARASARRTPSCSAASPRSR